MHSFLKVLQNFNIRHPVPTSLNKKREFVVSHNQENYWGGSQEQNYRAPGRATSGSLRAVLSEALVNISSSLCLSFLTSFFAIAIMPPYVTFSFSARRERRVGSSLQSQCQEDGILCQARPGSHGHIPVVRRRTTKKNCSVRALAQAHCQCPLPQAQTDQPCK